MIKYSSIPHLPHIQNLPKKHLRTKYSSSAEYISLGRGFSAVAPRYQMNCRIEMRYIERYYPEFIV